MQSWGMSHLLGLLCYWHVPLCSRHADWVLAEVRSPPNCSAGVISLPLWTPSGFLFILWPLYFCFLVLQKIDLWLIGGCNSIPLGSSCCCFRWSSQMPPRAISLCFTPLLLSYPMTWSGFAVDLPVLYANLFRGEGHSVHILPLLSVSTIGIDEAPHSAPWVRGLPNVHETKICCGFFLPGFRSERRQ